MIEEMPMPDIQAERIRRFVQAKRDRAKEYKVTEQGIDRTAFVVSESQGTVPARLLLEIMKYQRNSVLVPGGENVDRRDCAAVARRFEYTFKSVIMPQLKGLPDHYQRFEAGTLYAGREQGPIMPFYASQGFDWHAIAILVERDRKWFAAIDLTAKYTMPSINADAFIVVEDSLEAVQKTLEAITGEEWSLGE